MKTLLTFYFFVSIEHPEETAEAIRNSVDSSLKGTILVSHEGINAALCADRVILDQFCKMFESRFSFGQSLHFKWQPVSAKTERLYKKMKVVVVDQIITFGNYILKNNRDRGDYLDKNEWDQKISDPNVVVIDTRNTYESAIGSFKNAIKPEVDSFTEFKTFLDNQNFPTSQQLAIFCTGGIRCEKAGAYLREKGFEKVYQLKDGILPYLEQSTPSDSLWDGECFVFDERVSVGLGLVPGTTVICPSCRETVTQAQQKSDTYIQNICCPSCYSILSDDQWTKAYQRELKRLREMIKN